MCIFDQQKKYYVSLLSPSVRPLTSLSSGNKDEPSENKHTFRLDTKGLVLKERRERVKDAPGNMEKAPDPDRETRKSHDDTRLSSSATLPKPNNDERVNKWLVGTTDHPVTDAPSNPSHPSAYLSAGPGDSDVINYTKSGNPLAPVPSNTQIPPEFLQCLVDKVSRITDEVRTNHAGVLQSPAEETRLLTSLEELRAFVLTQHIPARDRPQRTLEIASNQNTRPKMSGKDHGGGHTASHRDMPEITLDDDAPIPLGLFDPARSHPKQLSSRTLPTMPPKISAIAEPGVSRVASAKPPQPANPEKATGRLGDNEKEGSARYVQQAMDEETSQDAEDSTFLIDLWGRQDTVKLPAPSSTSSERRPARGLTAALAHRGDGSGETHSILDAPVPPLLDGSTDCNASSGSEPPRIAPKEEDPILNQTTHPQTRSEKKKKEATESTTPSPQKPKPVNTVGEQTQTALSQSWGTFSWFVRDAEEAISKLVAMGPYLPGRVGLQVDFGRYLLYSVDESGLAFNPAGTKSNGWTKADLTERLKQCKDASFTKVITTAGDDIEHVVAIRYQETGEALWKPDPTTCAVYSFACFAGEKNNGESFFLDIDGTTEEFTYSLRASREYKYPVYVHGLLRNWDLRVIMPHTDTAMLEKKYGTFAKSMVDNLEVQFPQGSSDPRLGWHIPKEFPVEIKYVRTLTKWRFVSSDETSYLHVTEVLENQILPLKAPVDTKGQSLGFFQKGSPLSAQARTAKEKQGWPDRWYELSITSAVAKEFFDQNERLGFAEKTEWDFASLRKAGVLRSIFMPALRMLQEMDCVGGGNNNHQVHRMVMPRPNYELIPTEIPNDYRVRKNFLGPFW